MRAYARWAAASESLPWSTEQGWWGKAWGNFATAAGCLEASDCGPWMRVYKEGEKAAPWELRWHSSYSLVDQRHYSTD